MEEVRFASSALSTAASGGDAAGRAGGGTCVLVVEDDEDVRGTIATMLTMSGFSVVEAATVAEAEMRLAERDVAVALVDLRLGAENGMSLVRRLSTCRETAVLIVTGDDDPVERVLGIELGADDYITKPFNMRELVARVRRRADTVRLLRGTPGSAPATAAGGAEGRATVGGWTLDTRRCTAIREDGVAADLSYPEFRTLLCLSDGCGTIRTRDEIYSFVTGRGERDPLDRYVDNQVASLRRKLAIPGDSVIRTVHRVGYVID